LNIIVRTPTEEEIKELKTCPVWSSPVKVFPWYYDVKEICLIIEGEVEVTTKEGKINFKAGDLVIFPSGLNCEWNVTKAVKKYYKFG
jgi:uncharacterized cupin superfamily protein